MRCATCGATNADSADWCSQCFAPLGGTEAEADPAPPVTGEPEPPELKAEGFRRRGDIVEWECPVCGEWSGVENLRCPACKTSIVERWERGSDGEREAIERRFSEPWKAVLGLTAVVPGAGHIGLGRIGTGIARAVLFAVWLAGGVALWRAGGAYAGGPFLLGAALLWAGSMSDVLALRAGGRELLGGRSLLWLVVGVVGLSIVGMLAAAARGPVAAVVGVG